LYNNSFEAGIGEDFNNFVVLTMEAADSVKKIHTRMPVLLDEKTKEMWLDPNYKFADCLKAVVESKCYEQVDFYEVGQLVNSIKNDSEDCVMAAKDYSAKLHEKGLGKFFGKPVNIEEMKK